MGDRYWLALDARAVNRKHELLNRIHTHSHTHTHTLVGLKWFLEWRQFLRFVEMSAVFWVITLVRVFVCVID